MWNRGGLRSLDLDSALPLARSDLGPGRWPLSLNSYI